MRAALRAVEVAGELLESQEVARQVFGHATIADVPPSQAASVRRALRALVRRGEIEELGRDWERGRRKWGTHAEADKRGHAAPGRGRSSPGVRRNARPSSPQNWRLGAEEAASEKVRDSLDGVARHLGHAALKTARIYAQWRGEELRQRMAEW